MPARRREGRPLLDAAAWERAALDALVRDGPRGVAVEPIARRLTVTKGSFYHHFANRDALLRAALRRWEEEATEEIIRTLAPLEDPQQRFIALLLTVYTNPSRRQLDAAVNAAADDPIIRPVLRRVWNRRYTYVYDTYLEMGVSPEEAHTRTLLSYSAYLGLLSLERQLPGRRFSGEEREAYLRHLQRVFLPEGR